MSSYDPFGWVGADPGYLGIAFERDSQARYGWMRIVRDPETGNGVVVDWAWESDVAAPIQVAAVPEPEQDAMTMAVLAMGGAAVLARRRRLRAARRSDAG